MNIHHLFTATAGIDASEPDGRRIFTSKEEVNECYQQWVRQATLGPKNVLVHVVPVRHAGHGLHDLHGHGAAGAVAGVGRAGHGRAGMTGSGSYTRDQWLTDEHIAHPYMRQADGSRIDAVRHLDRGTIEPFPDRNPGRTFIGYSAGGFVTAPDVVRFAQALADGTPLNRPYADLYTGAKLPAPEPTAYGAYSGPLEILHGTQWLFGRDGRRRRHLRQLERLPRHQLGRRRPQQLRRHAGARGDPPPRDRSRHRPALQPARQRMTLPHG